METSIPASYIVALKQNTQASPPLTRSKVKSKKRFSHSCEHATNKNK